MSDRVTLAIIDAASAGDGSPSAWPGISRYLMPVANQPLICHVMRELARGGIEQARIVACSRVLPELEQLLGAGDSWGVAVSYTEAPADDGRRAVEREIRLVASREPVLVYPGDCLFPGQIGPMRERFSAGDVDLVLLAHAAGEASRGWVRKLMRSDEQPSRAADTAMILSPATLDALEDAPSGAASGDSVVESLLAAERPFAVCELGEHWCYSDSTDELLAGNQIVMDSLSIVPVRGSLGDSSEILGRVMISPSARVTASTIHGPALIGDHAVVEDSFIGPYTSIGPGVIAAGAEIDNSIVMAGAEIRHPGYRIEASVIGERASITRSFDLPKGLHLRIGPDGHVTLS